MKRPCQDGGDGLPTTIPPLTLTLSRQGRGDLFRPFLRVGLTWKPRDMLTSRFQPARERQVFQPGTTPRLDSGDFSPGCARKHAIHQELMGNYRANGRSSLYLKFTSEGIPAAFCRPPRFSV